MKSDRRDVSPHSSLRYEAKILGLVQGVGFRPHVARLARGLNLTGFVINDGTGVFVDIEGPQERLEQFFVRLETEAPPLARISTIERHRKQPVGHRSFSIRESLRPSQRFALISPDIATCEDCLGEFRDSSDRRHGYPFTNCTNCGPRFTIVTDVPYDRVRTTMRDFKMCDACRSEYTDESDRRYHAEPIACPTCGPSIRLVTRAGTAVLGEPIAETVALLKEGAIVAVKGLGGYHLACDARNALAVSTLRKRKCREEKPLAIMVRDIDAARAICMMSEKEETLLTSPQRPIVLLQKRGDILVADEVAPRNKYMGVMLPYTPLHHLLLEGTSPHEVSALVMTSGNLTDEPLAYKDEEALVRLGAVADYFLLHDRDIVTRCDDSVAKILQGKPQMIRRSRGYVPDAIHMSFAGRQLLAVGAELKNTFCLAKDDLAFLGHHIGDLKNLEAYEAFKTGIEHLKRLLFIEPELVAHDLHPDYLSTRYALESGLPSLAVQHHHAHIASCMAENGIGTRVIGLSFDGTGYGPDGTVWGGEFLVADFETFERLAHFAAVELPGGEAAINEPWRMAVSYLHATFGEKLARMNIPVVERIGDDKTNAIVRMIERGVNSPLTSSSGRLFDAVSSLVGLRDFVSFEGQAAMELEMVASDKPCLEPYPYRIVERAKPSLPDVAGKATPTWILDLSAMIEFICEDVRKGEATSDISRRFHETLSRATTEMCCLIRTKTSIKDVCLSGGVFQNALLSTLLVDSLDKAGFKVYLHSLVPPNDGGIALGQAAIASFAARTQVTGAQAEPADAIDDAARRTDGARDNAARTKE
ncbi:MAG: carbamoyltransferase HypF [Candidatus Eisenbacteria bacterium]|nr:carbamoyltransferase HypF [Candidatus Eisenbacteria bacterium]